MENSDQKTTLNPQSNTSTNNQFAEKQPLIDPSVLKTSKKIAIAAIGIVIILIMFQIIFNFIRNKTFIPNVNTSIPEPTEQPKPMAAKKFFSYLKDEKAIWISDTTGNNKEMILEIPTASKSFFSTITWKTPKNLTYVICEDSLGPCEINTISIEDKAITNEFNTEGLVKKLSWDKSGSYLAFVEEYKTLENEYSRSFRLKTGTVINSLSTFLVDKDLNNIRYNVQFGPNDKYIVFADTKKELIEKNSRDILTTYTSFIEVFILNGTKVDYIPYAGDPFFINESKLGYIKDRSIIYKEVGQKDETIATVFNGITPAISPDKSQIAYWYTEGNLNNVVLGVFDTNLNIHRNILRGIVLPKWISETEILGIKADNCLQGLNCELYQFQTNSISIVDIRKGNVIQIDQGKRISEPSFVFFDETQYAN
jgi:hypothetical protein